MRSRRYLEGRRTILTPEARIAVGPACQLEAPGVELELELEPELGAGPDVILELRAEPARALAAAILAALGEKAGAVGP